MHRRTAIAALAGAAAAPVFRNRHELVGSEA
jgi:hypothetical protein